jgi:hypothetical protein
MTGPEHYAHAEQVIAQVQNKDVLATAAVAYAAIAQVHATLALAAAMALQIGNPFPGMNPSHDAWAAVAAPEAAS